MGLGTGPSTPPAKEPLSVPEARQHARIDDSFEDNLVRTWITAARRHFEETTRRAFITQTWTVKLDDFWRGRTTFLVPRPPLQSVSSITYVDADGATQTWASSEYEVDTTSTPGRIALADGKSFPTTDDRLNAVTIVFVAGYGDDPEDVPAEIVAAIALEVEARWMRENGEISPTGTTIDRLIAPYLFRDERVLMAV